MIEKRYCSWFIGRGHQNAKRKAHTYSEEAHFKASRKLADTESREESSY